MYQRIRNLRDDKDLTQAQVAAAINCGQRAYSYYERGSRDLPSDILIQLALFHDTSIDYILGMTDIKKPYPRKKNNAKST